MTRELSHKTGVSLIKNTFAAKGAPITHTEALDLFAKLQGYEAWSHYHQATKKHKNPQKAFSGKMGEDCVVLPVEVFERFGTAQAYVEHLEGKHLSKTDFAGTTLREALIQQYGWDNELPSRPKSDWFQQTQGTVSYWDWVVASVKANNLWSGPEQFSPADPVCVTLPSGKRSKWNIEQNLTDRWGDLNFAYAERKPGLAVLELDEALRVELTDQMYDEITFIVRKDKGFGLLFEVEYASRESEGEANNPGSIYLWHKDIVAYLLKKLVELEELFPQVQFCVPDEGEIANNRPAIWGFCKSGALSTRQRKELGMSLLKL